MGVGWCKEMQGDDPLHLAFQARRGMGWVGRRQAPSVSLFERGRGMVGWVAETPLHLTFRVREGW